MHARSCEAAQLHIQGSPVAIRINSLNRNPCGMQGWQQLVSAPLSAVRGEHTTTGGAISPATLPACAGAGEQALTLFHIEQTLKNEIP